MNTARRAAPAIWLWRVVTMPAPRGARITGFEPGGRSATPPAMDLSLPAGWSLLSAPARSACDAGVLSRGTRSILGALTWYEQPLTLPR